MNSRIRVKCESRRFLIRVFDRLIVVSSMGLMSVDRVPAASVHLTASDPVGFSSFISGDNWSDGTEPRPGNSYFAESKFIRTPEAYGDHVFAGDSLEIKYLWMLVEGGDGSGKSYSLTVPELILRMSQVEVSRLGGATLSGKIVAEWTDNYITTGSEDLASPLTVTSAISGSGELRLVSNYDHSFIRLTANGSSDFGGSMVFDGGGTVDILGDQALGSPFSVLLQHSISVHLSGGVMNDYFPDDMLLMIDPDDSSNLHLDFDGTDTVGQVFVKGIGYLQPGTYGAVGNASADRTLAFLNGDGLIRVIPEPKSGFLCLLAVAIVSFRRNRIAASCNRNSGQM